MDREIKYKAIHIFIIGIVIIIFVGMIILGIINQINKSSERSVFTYNYIIVEGKQYKTEDISNVTYYPTYIEFTTKGGAHVRAVSYELLK